jgi:hypothetical protein
MALWVCAFDTKRDDALPLTMLIHDASKRTVTAGRDDYGELTP